MNTDTKTTKAQADPRDPPGYFFFVPDCVRDGCTRHKAQLISPCEADRRVVGSFGELWRGWIVHRLTNDAHRTVQVPGGLIEWRPTPVFVRAGFTGSGHPNTTVVHLRAEMVKEATEWLRSHYGRAAMKNSIISTLKRPSLWARTWAAIDRYAYGEKGGDTAHENTKIELRDALAYNRMLREDREAVAAYVERLLKSVDARPDSSEAYVKTRKLLDPKGDTLGSVEVLAEYRMKQLATAEVLAAAAATALKDRETVIGNLTKGYDTRGEEIKDLQTSLLAAKRLELTHKITALYRDWEGKVELWWQNLVTGNSTMLLVPVTATQGRKIAKVVLVTSNAVVDDKIRITDKPAKKRRR